MGEGHSASPATNGNGSKAKKASRHRNKRKAKKKAGVGQVQVVIAYFCFNLCYSISEILSNLCTTLAQPFNYQTTHSLWSERYWYWVIGYWATFTEWIVLHYWGIFFRCDTQYDNDKTAVGTVHMFIKHNHHHRHKVLRFYVV